MVQLGVGHPKHNNIGTGTRISNLVLYPIRMVRGVGHPSRPPVIERVAGGREGKIAGVGRWRWWPGGRAAGGGSTALESGGGEGAKGQLAGSIIHAHGPRDIFVA